ASRPSQRTSTSPGANEPSATVTSPELVRTAIRTLSALRSENSMLAALDTQRHTGEKTSETRVWEIGLGSSFRRCVTANAVAVATMSRSARIVGALRLIGARLYAPHAGRQPDHECRQPDAEANRYDVARSGHVE